MTDTSWHNTAKDLLEQGKGIRETARLCGKAYSTVRDYLVSQRLQSPVELGTSNIVKVETDKTAEGPTIIMIPDTQCKPGLDLSYLEWIGKYIASKKPDVIVHIGDHADMESLSSYDKGKKSAEGKRVSLDIEAAIEGMNTLLAPIAQEQAQDKSWKPRMVLTLGNHECLKPSTKVLTKRGFVKITDVRDDDLIAQRGNNGETVWGNHIGVVNKMYDGPMYSWKSQSLALSCTEGHRVLRKTSGGNSVYSLAKDVPDNFEVYSATSNSSYGVDLSIEQIKLGAWLCTDSYFTKNRQVVLYQRESNSFKIEQLLDSLCIKYSKKVRERDIKSICGKMLKKPCEKSVEFFLDKSVAEYIGVFSNKRLPEWAWDLNEDQWYYFLETLIDADGSIPTRATQSRVFYGKLEICENLQAIAVTKGYSASLKEYRPNQWRVNLSKQLSRRQENTEKDVCNYRGMVHCLVMPLGNFTIRDDYKVHVTGNCRIQRHVDSNAELAGFLSYDNLRYKEMGWEVYDYLEPVTIGGVMFIHYFPNPMSGKPLGGSAASILKTVGASIVQGHKQTLDVATRTLYNGKTQWSIIAGACYAHEESYKGYVGNKHWKGLVVMHNVNEGSFDPLFVSIDYLKERFN